MKTFAGKAPFLSAWILSALIGVGAAVFLLPSEMTNAGLPSPNPDWEKVAPWIVLGAIVLLMAMILSSLANPVLYRVLEGYQLWPQRAWDRGVRKQRERRNKVRADLAALAASETLKRGLLGERLVRYPTSDANLAPTRLGCATRAFEMYGYERFGLDALTLWQELESVTPEYLRSEIDFSRAPVDFAIGLTWLSFAYGVIVLILDGISLARGHLDASGVLQLLAFPLSYLWYEVAVASTGYWASVIRAMVNLGRRPLAEALGLELPPTIEAEREMWAAVSAFFYNSGYDAGRAAALDQLPYWLHKPRHSSWWRSALGWLLR
jgi:hypothetical protein